MLLDVLTIDRLHLDVRLPRGRPEWQALAPQLERLARERLASACEGACAGVLNGDPGVYVIDRLEVALSVNGGRLSERDLLDRWPQALVSQVRDVLAQPPPGVRVLRFESEADFLAAFLSELLDGEAWGKWYYRPFAALRSLPPGQSILQLLTEEGGRGHEALALLAKRGALERLLLELSDAQAGAIVERCLLAPHMPDVVIFGACPAWTRALTDLLGESQPAALTPWSGPKAALWLYLSLLRGRPDLGPDSHLACFVADLLLTSQAVAALPEVPRLLAALKAGQERAALRRLGSHAPGRALTFLAALLREAAPTDVAALLQVTLQAQGKATAESDAVSAETAASATSASSLFGGVFLLAPALVRLGVAEWLAGCPYPDPEELSCSKANLLLYLVGLQALGARWARQGIHDAGLAWFAGLEAHLERETLMTYARQITPSMQRAFLRELSRHLHAQGRGDAPEPGALVRGLGGQHLRAFRLVGSEEAVLHDRALDAALSLLTGAVVREFTKSLRGFEASGPDYLRRNFLLAPARLERDATRLHVHLERCPLEVVLRLSGFDREEPTPPWLDGRRLSFSFGT